MYLLVEKDDFEKLVAKVDALHDILKANTSEEKVSEWLTGDEVMSILKISSRCLQNYRDEGRIGFSQIGRRKIYYSRQSVIDLLKENYVEPFNSGS